MSTLSERIKLALNFSGISRKELAEACKVSQSTVTFWVNGRSKKMDTDNAVAAADALGVSVEWLSTGEGPMVPENIVAVSPDCPVSSEQVIPIPFYEIRASAGPGCPPLEYEVKADMSQAYYPNSWFLANHLNPKHCRMLTVSGESMEPLIWDHDHILVDCSPIEYSEIKDGGVYVFAIYGEVRIKHLYKDSRRGLTLRSANPQMREEHFSQEELEACCFEMIGRVRDRQGNSGL